MKRDPNSGLGMLFDALKDSGVDMDNLKDMANPMKPAGASKKAQEEEIASEVDEILEDVVEEAEEESGSGMPFEKPSYNHKNKKGKGKGTDGPAATLIEDIAEWSKKRLILAIIIAVIVLAGAYWWFHPAINIHSADFWFPVLVIAFLLFTFFKIKGRLAAAGTKRTEKNEGKAKTFKVLSYIPLLVIAAWAIGYVMTFSVFPGNAEKYANILKIETEDFAEDIQEVNYSQIPVIDRSTASLLANKEMGTISEYVSQFEISPLFSQINYKGAPVRVSPLGYADLFKWLTNRNPGIPAYSLVDMTTQNAQIVTLPAGSEIKYSASEPLARNIDRYVQLKYPFYMFDEKSFEIDDNGHPWWICPVQDYTIGLFGGCTISRAVLVDASTGECFDYDIKDVPQWVDHVFPAELLIQQYNWHGSLLNGWFNSWLGQAGVTQTTPGNNGQSGYNYIAKDDDVWVYTGVTSVTSDNSIIGFMLVNQRTQEAHFYSVAGATETAAMSSAEGQVQHLRYSATFPILINVADQPTYFMALKDGEGLVKKFAMVDIKSYQIVSIGDSVAECQTSYLNLLVSNGIQLPDSEEVVIGAKASGEISKIGPVVIDGNTHYYVMLEGNKNLFEFPIAVLPEIFMYEKGDSISFTYIDGTSPYTVQSIG